MCLVSSLLLIIIVAVVTNCIRRRGFTSISHCRFNSVNAGNHGSNGIIPNTGAPGINSVNAGNHGSNGIIPNTGAPGNNSVNAGNHGSNGIAGGAQGINSVNAGNHGSNGIIPNTGAPGSRNQNDPLTPTRPLPPPPAGPGEDIDPDAEYTPMGPSWASNQNMDVPERGPNANHNDGGRNDPRARIRSQPVLRGDLQRPNARARRSAPDVNPINNPPFNDDDEIIDPLAPNWHLRPRPGEYMELLRPMGRRARISALDANNMHNPAFTDDTERVDLGTRPLPPVPGDPQRTNARNQSNMGSRDEPGASGTNRRNVPVGDDNSGRPHTDDPGLERVRSDTRL